MDTGPLPGPLAMAVDEALLHSYEKGPDYPLLRFYGWDGPSVSIGRFQSFDDDIYPENCEAAGVPMVRRITGGGAIFHDHELTYSLVCSRHDFGSMSVKESYRKICSFLLEYYRSLGLDVEYAVDRSGASAELGQKTVHCFAGTEAFDISLRYPDGSLRKLGGNAQRRMGSTVFQHGSIPLRLDIAQQKNLFAEHALPDPQKVTDLYSALEQSPDFSGTFPTRGEMITGLRRSFAGIMNIEWQDIPVTAVELADADMLVDQKYARNSWNYHRGAK